MAVDTFIQKYEKYYENNAIKYMYLAIVFNIITIVCGALTPIFAAIDQKLITIVLGAIVAISIGILKFGKFDELWFNYRTTRESLRREIDYFNNGAGIYSAITVGGDRERKFVENVESIIAQENGRWLNAVTPQTE